MTATDGGFAAPESVGEAVALLGELGERAKVLAGGQSLVLMLHDRLLAPEVLVYLGGIAELAAVDPDGEDGMRLGGMVTLRALSEHPLVRERAPALAAAAGRIASPHVRQMGTVGGNLCHNLVGADLPPVLLACEAEAEVAGPRGARRVPLSSFFHGFMETAVAPDELLVAVRVPGLGGRRSVYLKHAVRVVDPAIVGVAAVGRLVDGRWSGVRLGLGGAGEVPVRLHAAEELLEGRPAAGAAAADAARAAAAAIDCIDDAHASAAYRRRMAEVFVRRALAGLAVGGA